MQEDQCPLVPRGPEEAGTTSQEARPACPPRTKSFFPSPAVTLWCESWPNPPWPRLARRKGVTDARPPGSDSGDSPARGQDALLVGAALDAAHAHGVSVSRRARPQQAPGRGTSPGGRPRRGRGWCHMPGAGPSDLPLTAEHRVTGHPGVPAFQQAIVPTCGNKHPVAAALITGSGHFPGRKFTSVGEFPWVTLRQVASGGHQAGEPPRQHPGGQPCAVSVSLDLKRRPQGSRERLTDGPPRTWGVSHQH